MKVAPLSSANSASVGLVLLFFVVSTMVTGTETHGMLKSEVRLARDCWFLTPLWVHYDSEGERSKQRLGAKAQGFSQKFRLRVKAVITQALRTISYVSSPTLKRLTTLGQIEGMMSVCPPNFAHR